MEHVAIGGRQVPALGLGTWQLNGAGCRQAVSLAIELGYRHIDTAQAYGNEREIGAAIAESGIDREELWLTTKIANRQHAPDRVRSSTEDSLRALRTDHVDLLLLHWPVEFDRIGETLEAMVGLLETGRTRYVGVSNFSPRQFEEALEHAPVVCNQVEFHPFLDQTDVLATARKHDAVVTAYSPLARGGVMRDETLQTIAEAHGRSPAQVTLRWLLDHDGVVSIPKASSREHLESNLAVFDFALTDDDRRRIDDLERGHRIVDPSGIDTDW